MIGMRVVQCWIVLALGLLSVAPAAAQSLQAQLRADGQAFAGVPFGLTLVVDGAGESPAPSVAGLQIANASVRGGQFQPQVSRSISIINGQRQAATVVRWVANWQVTPQKNGTLAIPDVTVQWNGKTTVASGGAMQVQSIPETSDMKLILAWPERPIWVGETIAAELTWLIRRDVSEQTFELPLLNMPDDFVVTAPPVVDARRALAFGAGAAEVKLPYEQDETELGGERYARFRFRLLVAPRRAGVIAVAPAVVTAAIASGRPDFFGNAPTKLFRAASAPTTVTVKELPQSGRPGSFWGAVGDAFAITAAASRSVVRIGEPLDLTLTIKSNQRLDGLTLGKLDGEGGLPPDVFRVPQTLPTGQLSEDGKTKTFVLTLQVLAATSQLPGIAFSYFDPQKGDYQTVRSEPIALSVEGGTMVGAAAVVTTQGGPPSTSGAGPAANTAPASLVGADLTLSSGGTGPAGVPAWLWYAMAGLLYLLPFGVAWRLARQRAGRSSRESEYRTMRRALEQALARAAAQPAREAVGPLMHAVTQLARMCDRKAEAAALATRLETEAYAPTAGALPLPSALRDEVQRLTSTWKLAAPLAAGHTVGMAALLLSFAVAFGAPAVAQASGEAAVGHGATPDLAAGTASRAAAAAVTPGPNAAGPGAVPGASAAPLDARAAYQAAMAQTDTVQRKAAFAQAAVGLRSLAFARPTADAFADWGNAALGAGDVAQATIAYRRALALDGSHARAQQNLNWLRARQPAALRAQASGATDTLLFFHSWPRPYKLVLGAFAFCVAGLLLLRWPRGRLPFAPVAVLPLIAWVGLTASAGWPTRVSQGAVVIDSVILRAADSLGAPAVQAEPLAQGTEVTIATARGGWAKVVTAGGNAGWVPDGALTRVP